MDYTNDIFLNFHLEDDGVKTSSEEYGWVSHFKKYIAFILNQLLNREVKIIGSDTKPSLTDLAQSATMVSIISKKFIRDKESVAEAERFITQHSRNNGHSIPVFKVFKHPVPFERQPEILRSYLGYNLFKITEYGVEEFSDFFDDEAERIYWTRMADLAYNIFQILSMRQGTSTELPNERPITTRQTKERRYVYLAEVSDDLFVHRYIIKRELQRFGFEVLPNRALPLEIKELEAQIKEDLLRCNYSIHLIGKQYGEIAKNSTYSLIDLQNRIAASITQDNPADENADESEIRKLQRLIWLPTFLKEISEKHRTFIEKLKQDTEGTQGAEVLQTPLEDLKGIIRMELIDKQKKNKLDVTRDENRINLYLIYDRVDKENIEPLKNYLLQENFNVLEPFFEGKLLDIRFHHIQLLKISDAAIVYNGLVDKKWVNAKVADLLKAPGFGRKNNKLYKALLLEKENNIKNDLLDFFDISIVEDAKNFKESETFISFINLIKAI